ncbi:uncharacterized protein BJ171DRAFT_484690 [Polychytrium aggregatum]|uniref:uncharacterized protein n=1 Tax=Polychytrium aggregatum TaxID=110093 RepID=UPI0022FE4726|nr:uncharacterized protein BJ171DRAFT_484690 [Polychytrium aggregatum]KAI9209676.1 hypothetical protein BJ171DRAFT_484690 [Polychytrium aggregatum]
MFPPSIRTNRRLAVHAFARLYSTATSAHPIKVAIIGSGPAGFYTAHNLLKNERVQVDMYESLPVPFGLVRFGVAPDHPEVKNVINKFETIGANDRFQFYGNIRVGDSVPLQAIQSNYHYTVLSYGASEDRHLGIDNEDSLQGIHSARSFVGWYNGHPDFKDLAPNLDTETAIVVGQGNVALDVARILLSPIEELEKTDICEHALEALRKSSVKHVHIVGRRGPLQIAFTSKELREIMGMPNTRFIIDRDYVEKTVSEHKAALTKDRPRKRLLEILVKPQEPADSPRPKTLTVHFLKTPRAAVPDSSGARLAAVKFEDNELRDDAVAVGTGSFTEIPAGLLFRSVGYKGTGIPGLHFDSRRGVVPNNKGRALDSQGKIIPRLYVAGWLKRGPTGVIATTMHDANETSTMVLEDIHQDLEAKEDALASVSGAAGVLGTSAAKAVDAVSFSEWKAIDAYEREQGQKLGKPREKIVSTEEMLRLVHEARAAKA